MPDHPKCQDATIPVHPTIYYLIYFSLPFPLLLYFIVYSIFYQILVYLLLYKIFFVYINEMFYKQRFLSNF